MTPEQASFLHRMLDAGTLGQFLGLAAAAEIGEVRSPEYYIGLMKRIAADYHRHKAALKEQSTHAAV